MLACSQLAECAVTGKVLLLYPMCSVNKKRRVGKDDVQTSIPGRTDTNRISPHKRSSRHLLLIEMIVNPEVIVRPIPVPRRRTSR